MKYYGFKGLEKGKNKVCLEKMNLDLDTLQSIRHYIKKQIDQDKGGFGVPCRHNR